MLRLDIKHIFTTHSTPLKDYGQRNLMGVDELRSRRIIIGISFAEDVIFIPILQLNYIVVCVAFFNANITTYFYLTLIALF